MCYGCKLGNYQAVFGCWSHKSSSVKTLFFNWISLEGGKMTPNSCLFSSVCGKRILCPRSNQRCSPSQAKVKVLQQRREDHRRDGWDLSHCFLEGSIRGRARSLSLGWSLAAVSPRSPRLHSTSLWGVLPTEAGISAGDKLFWPDQIPPETRLPRARVVHRGVGCGREAGARRASRQ